MPGVADQHDEFFGSDGGWPVADLAVTEFNDPQYPVGAPGEVDGDERQSQRGDQRRDGVQIQVGRRIVVWCVGVRADEPTVEMPGSALGDAVGISWLLGEVGGAKVVAHGGTTNGQHSEFKMIPERGFAIISMTNAGPNGPVLNDRLWDWALEHYLGLA